MDHRLPPSRLPGQHGEHAGAAECDSPDEPGPDPLALRVLLTTLVLTPIMTYWVLPWVTRLLRGWLAPTA